MRESTQNNTANRPATARLGRLLGIVVVVLAIALSVASCTLLLLIPSASIDVETVYGGF